MRAQPIAHYRNTPAPPARHPHHHSSTSPAAIVGAAVAGALIALAFGVSSAAAQTYAEDPYVGEVTVTGPANRDGPMRMSRVVSIRDLDLTTRYGQEQMRLRIRATARDLCRELGEGRDYSSAVAPTCVDRAIRDVRPQVRVATQRARINRAYAYFDYPYDYRLMP